MSNIVQELEAQIRNATAATISEKNRKEIAWTQEEVEALFDQGYTNCGNCKGHNWTGNDPSLCGLDRFWCVQW